MREVACRRSLFAAEEQAVRGLRPEKADLRGGVRAEGSLVLWVWEGTWCSESAETEQEEAVRGLQPEGGKLWAGLQEGGAVVRCLREGTRRWCKPNVEVVWSQHGETRTASTEKTSGGAWFSSRTS